MNFYKLDPDEEMIVIFDDISLEPGRIRIRKKGSAGGHNGIKSIIAMTGTQGFSRIKVGVGEKPQGWDLADHVLGRFSSEDRAKVEEAIGHAMDAAVLMMQGETDKAMNIYNWLEIDKVILNRQKWRIESESIYRATPFPCGL